MADPHHYNRPTIIANEIPTGSPLAIVAGALLVLLPSIVFFIYFIVSGKVALG